MQSIPDLLLRKAKFMQWGDERIMAAAGNVHADEYYRDRGISFGSLHKLLVHVMGAQWVWLQRWKGNSPPKLPDVADYPTRESIAGYWPVLHREFIDFIAAENSETLLRSIHYRNSRGEAFTLPLLELILHTLDHGTYHRGQANTLIKLAGGTPVSINYFEFSQVVPSS